jgi:hypothetical protein
MTTSARRLMIEKWLRALVYFAVTILCFVRIGSYWRDNHLKSQGSVQSRVASLLGTRISLERSSAGAASRATIVIAMTTSCLYCRAGASFYRKLLHEARGLPGSVRTIAVMPESTDIPVSYLHDSLALTFDDVVTGLPGFVVRFTPTLLVADEQGVVKGAWIGVPKPAAEAEALAALCGIAGIDGARCHAH